MSINLSRMVQPRKSIAAGSIAYMSGVYACSSIGQPCTCSGAELAADGTTGILKVHLVNDPETQYYPMPLEAGYRNSAEFDQVIESGTTVDVSKVTLFVVTESN